MPHLGMNSLLFYGIAISLLMIGYYVHRNGQRFKQRDPQLYASVMIRLVVLVCFSALFMIAGIFTTVIWISRL